MIYLGESHKSENSRATWQVADEEARSKAHEQFSKVQKAYDVLRVPKTRREYDNGLNVSDS